MICKKCDQEFKGQRGLDTHQRRNPNCNTSVIKKRKPKINFEWELMALQIRCELAAKLLMGAI